MRSRNSLRPSAAVGPALAAVALIALALALLTHRGSVPASSDPAAALMRGIPDHAIDQLIVAGTAVLPDRTALVSRSAEVTIRGWIILPGGVPGTAAYRIDGGAVRRARSHLARADVADAMSAPAARDCGFRIVLPPGTLGPGPHAVSVFSVDPGDGTARVLPSAVHLVVRG